MSWVSTRIGAVTWLLNVQLKVYFISQFTNNGENKIGFYMTYFDTFILFGKDRYYFGSSI